LETQSNRVLDPMERISEILFGLIMVLTVTGSVSVVDADRRVVRDLLIAAIGCNLAWGVIDAVLYLMARFSEQGRSILALRAVRETQDGDKAQRIISGAIPPLIASLLTPAEFEAIRQRLKQVPEPPANPRLTTSDWLGGLGVFLLVVGSTFPVLVPFLFLHDAKLALRVSNAVAIVLLYLLGSMFGRYAGHRQLLMGFVMVMLGGILVAITIALGG
jgi:VIT1/CCC1 family predicted Fe2+/Mn2+ transporter